MFATATNADISYDYIEIGYEKVTIDSFESADDLIRLSFDNKKDGDGFSFEGSFSFADNYFAYADFDNIRFDLSNDEVDTLNSLGTDLNVGSSIDRNTQEIGVGYHTDGNNQFVAKAAFLRQAIDAKNLIKEGAIGYSLEFGGRGLLSNNFEWEANLEYTDPDANDGPSAEIGVNTSLRYHFENNFSTDFSASTADGDVTYGLNLRYNFGR